MYCVSRTSKRAPSLNDRATVTDLTASFGVERRAIENEGSFLAGAQRRDGAAFFENGDDSGGRFESLVVAGELAANRGKVGQCDDFAFCGGVASRAIPLLFHEPVECNRIHDRAALGGDLAG